MGLDDFNITGGSLAGLGANVGGRWTAQGDRDDFAVERMTEADARRHYKCACGAHWKEATFFASDNVAEMRCDAGHIRKVWPGEYYTPIERYQHARDVIKARCGA